MEKTQKGIDQYVELLDRILEETKQEETSLKSYITLEKATYIPIWLHEPDTFDAYAVYTEKRVKKQVKRIDKDLLVSSSRYKYSFDSQISRMENIEAFIAFNKKKPKQ